MKTDAVKWANSGLANPACGTPQGRRLG
jgi:hypothetical protein